MAISVDHLGFSYGSMTVLRDICAQALNGRITAVLGPNAAGKSTLLKCIIGALRPARNGGRVLIDGETVHLLSARQMAGRAAYVPQRSTVSAAFTVRQVVELGRYALPAKPSLIDAAIDRLDLADIADRPYPKLSVGQQQRVTVARALAQLGPPTSGGKDGHGSASQPANWVLVLDEPTSAMDLEHIASTALLLRELARRGVTILLAMHDLSLAAAIADEVWLLEGGRLIASGPAGEVLSIERLRGVFRAEFQWVQLPDGARRLFAEMPVQQPPMRLG